MDEAEKDRIQKSLEIHRTFLRNIHTICESRYKMKISLGKSELAELRVLLAVLRATSKGDIPMTKHRYDIVNAKPSFRKVLQFKDDAFYHKMRNLGRSDLIHFLSKLGKLWKVYLFPLLSLK